MLRITTSHSAEAAKNYFDVALITSDYYTKDVGTWGGKGAEILGLKGDVQRKDFVALANNRWPGANGKRLTARMNKTRLENVIDKTGVPTIDPETGTVQQREVSNRRAGYDFTFSAPKSVSLYLSFISRWAPPGKCTRNLAPVGDSCPSPSTIVSNHRTGTVLLVFIARL
jgi:hypothetical protein